MSDRTATSVGDRLDALLSGTRLTQFVSVGAVGTLVDTATLFALVELNLLGPLLAKVIGWELSIVIIFVINERWTFARYGPTGAPALGLRFLRSNAVRFGGFVVTMVVFWSLIQFTTIWYIAANLVGIATGFVVNYTFETLYIWKVHEGAP